MIQPSAGVTWRRCGALLAWGWALTASTLTVLAQHAPPGVPLSGPPALPAPHQQLAPRPSQSHVPVSNAPIVPSPAAVPVPVAPTPAPQVPSTAAALVTPPAALLAARQPMGEFDDPNYQSAPASESYDRRAVDTYNFFASYYDEPGIGPRPYADYAPDGFYPLDYQEAPGAPLYERILPPARVTPEQLSESVIRGPLPGSFIVPGTGTAFRFSGFVRMGSTFDYDPIGSVDTFVTRTIPVPNGPGQNINFSARPTRLSMDTWTPVRSLEWTVHTFIQMDFLSGNPPGTGSSFNPRLRFAFIDIGYFRIGQDTTVFMDPSSFPRTADFQGPNGIVNTRQGLARVTLPIAERMHWAGAIEQPFSDISTFGQGNNVQDVPDFTTHVRYDADRFHAQASGIARTIGYRATNEPVDRQAGWGINLSSNFHPWALLMDTNPLRDDDPGGLTRSRVLLQYVFGDGIGRYLQDTNGQGFDAAVDLSGDLEVLSADGWTVAYEHWFTASWLTNLAYSNLDAGSTDAMSASTFAASKYLAASLWWIPIQNLSLGVEYLWGERENLDGETGRASRLQTACQYNF